MPGQDDFTAQMKRRDEEAVRLHALYRGKMQVALKCPIRGPADFSNWYTPGVAAACRAIQADPMAINQLTNKANLIAVVSDGSRVLGLGNIGPLAALPVMEGKALLYKYLGGVDAVAICLGTQDSREFVRTVQLLEPSFGGINLEDIEQPRCFRVLEELRHSMKIPVWHDDQQGSATALLAGLLGALRVVDKKITSVRIAMIGMGAANFSVYRMLKAVGVNPAQIVACDSKGTLHRNRVDIVAGPSGFPEKWAVCQESNVEIVDGGIEQALRGADVCIAYSRSDPTLIKPEWIRAMTSNAIVFACANPVPEIWPSAAKQAGARIVATGRGDFPNQVNNSLAFPGIFRGALDSQAVTITDEMAIAGALELASIAEESGLGEESIIPAMSNAAVVPRVAAAIAMKAQEKGLARVSFSREEYIKTATQRIEKAQGMLKMMMDEHIIGPVIP